MTTLRNPTFPFLLLLFFSLTAAAAPRHTTKIESQRNEKWWGIFVSSAPAEPFQQPFSINTARYMQDGLLSPMLISSNGRYIWSSRPMQIEFDGRDFTIGSDYEKVSAAKGGRNLREAYLVCCHKNFPPDGTVPSVELFTRPVYNTRMEFGYGLTQQKLLDYADRILGAGLPAGTLLVSDGWRSYNGTYDFDKDFFPDPRAMVDRLHEKGFKVMLTVTPFGGAFGRSYITGLRNGFFLRKADGTPLIVEAEGGYSTCIHAGNPEEAELLGRRLDRLRDEYGIDGFRFDCRAVLPHLAESGGQAADFMSGWMKLGRGLSLCEYLPGLNTPLTPYINCIENDNGTGWESLQPRINDMLTAGLTGFPYCHISAHHADTSALFSDPLLMARTLQLAVMMPIPNVAFAPWRIADPDLQEQVKRTLALRERMAGYVEELVRESSRTAEPLIRHMEYQYPRNGFADCNDQFMLGARYLIAPALNDAATRTVRLPRGVWLDREGRRFKGPLVIEVNVADGGLAWFESASKQ